MLSQQLCVVLLFGEQWEGDDRTSGADGLGHALHATVRDESYNVAQSAMSRSVDIYAEIPISELSTQILSHELFCQVQVG